jgi:hypothetical protein
MDKYPWWYQSKNRPRGGVPDEPHFPSYNFSNPNVDSVVCQTNPLSPQFEDCVHAFGTLEGIDRNTIMVKHKKNGVRW